MVFTDITEFKISTPTSSMTRSDDFTTVPGIKSTFSTIRPVATNGFPVNLLK